MSLQPASDARVSYFVSTLPGYVILTLGALIFVGGGIALQIRAKDIERKKPIEITMPYCEDLSKPATSLERFSREIRFLLPRDKKGGIANLVAHDSHGPRQADMRNTSLPHRGVSQLTILDDYSVVGAVNGRQIKWRAASTDASNAINRVSGTALTFRKASKIAWSFTTSFGITNLGHLMPV